MSKGNLVGSYWLVRVVFLRCLAILYAVAFLVAFNQNESLLGEDGLTPAILYVKQRPPDRSDLEMLLVQPTLFWYSNAVFYYYLFVCNTLDRLLIHHATTYYCYFTSPTCIGLSHLLLKT